VSSTVSVPSPVVSAVVPPVSLGISPDSDDGVVLVGDASLLPPGAALVLESSPELGSSSGFSDVHEAARARARRGKDVGLIGLLPR